MWWYFEIQIPRQISTLASSSLAEWLVGVISDFFNFENFCEPLVLPRTFRFLWLNGFRVLYFVLGFFRFQFSAFDLCFHIFYFSILSSCQLLFYSFLFYRTPRPLCFSTLLSSIPYLFWYAPVFEYSAPFLNTSALPFYIPPSFVSKYFLAFTFYASMFCFFLALLDSRLRSPFSSQSADEFFK